MLSGELFMGLFKLIKESYSCHAGPRRYSRENLRKAEELGVADKAMGDNINGTKGMTLKEYSRYQYRIIGVLKYLFFFPVVNLFAMVAGKFLLKKSPDGFAFRNYQAYDRAAEKARVIWYDVYLQDADLKNPLKRFRHWLHTKSCEVLTLLHRVEITLLLSDSAYFEYKNIELLEIYKEMSKLHGDSPVHILYKDKRNVNDPVYFAACNEGVEVALKQRLQTLKPFYDSNGKLKVKYVGGGLSSTIDSVAVELNCLPKKDLLISQIRKLKQENVLLKQSLININAATIQGLGVKADASKEVRV